MECIGHVLSVQDTAGALEQVKAIFNPYVEGFAQLIQQQVMLIGSLRSYYSDAEDNVD